MRSFFKNDEIGWYHGSKPFVPIQVLGMKGFFIQILEQIDKIINVNLRGNENGKFIHAGDTSKNIKELFFGLTTGKKKKYSHFCTPVYK
jgi:hypothetical protein